LRVPGGARVHSRGGGMKTSRCVAATLLFGLVFALFSGFAFAQCTANGFGCCADGTPSTPCCGYGPCNVFCGNCDGGCRRAPDPLPPGWNPSCGQVGDALGIGKAINEGNGGTQKSAKPPAAPLVGRALFDKIDANHDGTISLAETQAWAKA